MSDLKEISVGKYHTLYLKVNGTVWAVGLNSSGQLGDGTTTNRINPVQVMDASGYPLSGVVRISAGNEYSVFSKSDGSVWATGYNASGQLGNGTTSYSTYPVQVVEDSGSPFEEVKEISAGMGGSGSTFYLKADGTVWAAGYNGVGTLGNGTYNNTSTPVQVVDASGNPLNGVAKISVGVDHSVFLKGDGTVWAVGYNSNGQLGDGTNTLRTNPVQVVDGSGNPLSGVVGISAGNYHTVYLKEDGTVWATGKNENGQLGDGTTTGKYNPVQVLDVSGNPLTGVVEISAGRDHSVFLKGDGTVWAVGLNSSGQLGDGTNTLRTNPVQVVDASGNPLSEVVSLNAGGAVRSI